MKKLSLIFALLIISSSLVLAESIVDMGPFRKVTTEVSNDKTCFAEVDSMRNFQLFALATKSGDEEYARAKYVLSNYIHANRGEKIRARVQLSIPEGSYAGFARGRSFVWAMVRSSDGTGQPIGPIVVADSRLQVDETFTPGFKTIDLETASLSEGKYVVEVWITAWTPRRSEAKYAFAGIGRGEGAGKRAQMRRISAETF